ncbi:MAG: polyphenol oxidase family protein [Syntrophobacteraceae bacterium]
MSKNKAFITSAVLSGVPGLVHGFFTRSGGVSKPPFESMNVSWSNGDSAERVFENLCRIRDLLGLDRLVSGPQVHGAAINFVDKTALSSLESRPPLVIAPRGDALATNISGTGLLIKVADCQSVMVVDPEARVAANVHSGWRGSVQNIVGKTVDYLRARRGCVPGRMLAAVGPSLGPCCAEFINFRDEIPPHLWRFQVRPQYFDFWEITRGQLVSAGIRDENIEVIGRCTVCESSEFFSYRAERETGRMAAVIGWRQA